jgi:hypothetical protein
MRAFADGHGPGIVPACRIGNAGGNHQHLGEFFRGAKPARSDIRSPGPELTPHFPTVKNDLPIRHDLRLSFPLGLFCMATLSCSLFLALEQSVSPPLPHHVSPGSNSPMPQEQLHHDPRVSRVHHLSDGLDDDLYLHDVESHLHFHPHG